MTVLEQALVRLSQTLSDNGIPYMIIGGMANAVWGEPRATLDIDATVWVRDDEISGTITTLEKVFQPLVSNPRQFIRDTSVLPLQTEEGVRIDLIFGTLPYEQKAIARAVALSIADYPVRFCTPEDLILHKIVSERERDLADAQGVALRRIQSLDITYLDSCVRELADSLGRSEILSNWERWKREAKDREPEL